MEKEALSPLIGSDGFLLGPVERAEAQLVWEAKCPGSPFFAFLDERTFLAVALLSFTVSLMAFLEDIKMIKRTESFHEY